jgi:hypothetical protein
MRTQWHPPTAIESLFVQIEDGVAFTVEGLDEPTKPTILWWAYEIISLTGRFEISCREWRHMDTKTKTRALFKSHFKAADRDIRSQATSGTAGYHGTPYAAANSVTTHVKPTYSPASQRANLPLPKPSQLHISRIPSTQQPPCRPSPLIPLGYTSGLMVYAGTSATPVIHVSILAKAIK